MERQTRGVTLTTPSCPPALFSVSFSSLPLVPWDHLSLPLFRPVEPTFFCLCQAPSVRGAGRTKMRLPHSLVNLLKFFLLSSFSFLPLPSLPFTPPKPFNNTVHAFTQPQAKQWGSNCMAPALTEPGPAMLPDGAGATGCGTA